jgi:pimeloyl-ACP methyl ester carboxylesterase
VISVRYAIAIALVVLWLGLRGALALSGGEVGSPVTLHMAGGEVAALSYRGAAPAPTLLVVAHGGLASKETLASLCWEARARGADCVAVDLLGHGGSSAIPRRDSLATMREALRADRASGLQHARVRFIGHSLGAALGCGAAFRCDECAAMGQPVDCPNVFWGSVHRALGLPQSWYLLSHVLEPWTPEVVDRAVGATLGAVPGSRPRIALRIALAWASLVFVVAAGAVVAREVRASSRGVPWMRSAAAAAVLWFALSIGAWHILWFTVPTQASDLVWMGAVIGGASLTAWAARAVGIERPWVGVALAMIAVEAVAVAAYVTFPVVPLRGLLVLPPILLAPVGLTVWVVEAATRAPRSTAVESAVFSACLLGASLALLLPA